MKTGLEIYLSKSASVSGCNGRAASLAISSAATSVIDNDGGGHGVAIDRGAAPVCGVDLVSVVVEKWCISEEGYRIGL